MLTTRARTVHGSQAVALLLSASLWALLLASTICYRNRLSPEVPENAWLWSTASPPRPPQPPRPPPHSPPSPPSQPPCDVPISGPFGVGPFRQLCLRRRPGFWGGFFCVYVSASPHSAETSILPRPAALCLTAALVSPYAPCRPLQSPIFFTPFAHPRPCLLLRRSKMMRGAEGGNSRRQRAAQRAAEAGEGGRGRAARKRRHGALEGLPPLDLEPLGLPAPLTPQLHQNSKVRAAMAWAMAPDPKVKTGDDCSAESEALSAIIQCVTQDKRGALVEHLLFEQGFSTFPPAGCAFSPGVLPPLMTAIVSYDTFEDQDEWEKMFAALEDAGDMGAEWGPEQLSAGQIYFSKFGVARMQ